MRSLLCPDWVFNDYTDITAEFLASHGVRLLIADLDFTLAPKRVKDPDETVFAWLSELHRAGIKVVILSNNRDPQRVRRFCEPLGIPFVGRAQKPYKHSYLAVMARFGVTRGETMALGDKLLTDTLGAKRSGLRVLVVEPKGGAVGLWQKVLYALQQPFKCASAHDERY